MRTIEEQINEAIEAIKALPKGVLNYNKSENFDAAFGVELCGFTNEDLQLYAQTHGYVCNIKAVQPWCEIPLDNGARFFARLKDNTSDKLKSHLASIFKSITDDYSSTRQLANYRSGRAVA